MHVRAVVLLVFVVGPAAGDGLGPGVEPDAFRAVHVGVAALLAASDVPGDGAPGWRRAHGANTRGRRGARADVALLGLLLQPRDQGVARVAHGHHRGDGHAPRPGRAVARRRDVVGGE